MRKYVAFLRGINVGGHHKLTLLNSGNIIFEADDHDRERLEHTISEQLQKAFGFPVPTIVRTAEYINALILSAPFKDILLTKDKRFYISFLRNDVISELTFPWVHDDSSYTILSNKDKTIWSVLDLSISNTPKAMEVLEKTFGSDITTRNWSTIKRIEKKLQGQ